jgi:signal transduction histidine kinase
VIVSAPDFRVAYVNAAFERVTDRTAGDWLGHGLEELHPECTTVLNTHHQTELELRIVRRDDSISRLVLSLMPIYDTSNRLTHFLGLTTEQACCKSWEDQERGAELNSVLGNGAGGVAEDLHTVMTSIRGQCQKLLRELAHDSVRHQILLPILRASERAERLAWQIVDFGREGIE